MSYLLGFIFADGAIEDVRKSSRTCYIALTSKDKELLYQLRSALSSNHKIYKREPQIISIRGRDKKYISSVSYQLRIGNKIMFQDLINLGVRPRKSLRLILPDLPEKYFGFYLRGYFDGDGCLYVGIPKGRNIPRVRMTFTSGTLKFLKELTNKLNFLVGTSKQKVFRAERAYGLSYSKRDSIKILHLIYSNLESAPFLRRKYEIYKNFQENNSLSGLLTNNFTR